MFSFKNIKDNIDYNDYNALVYLLRKFKKLSTSLQIGAYDLTSDYGDFHFTDGFESIGSNFILNNEVTVTSDSVLKNAFYTFIFTVLDVNLSGVVNKRNIKVTTETGENGVLELTIPADLIENNEVILPNFDVEVVFDEHEYYTPISNVEINLSCDKKLIKSNEIATITVRAIRNDMPLSDLTLFINVNGINYRRITNNQGIATLTYRGNGNVGEINVKVANKSIYFYDYDNATIAEFSGNTVKFGGGTYFTTKWLLTNGDVIIDWGDESRTTVNNPAKGITHNYSDGLSEHTVLFIGEVVGIGDYCFWGYNSASLTSISISPSVTTLEKASFSECPDLTYVDIPQNVISFGDNCFAHCDILPSIKIPSNVTEIGKNCFQWCWLLDDFQLYWESNPFPYDFDKIPYGIHTIFTIPPGTRQIYIDAGYPANKLVERSP